MRPILSEAVAWWQTGGAGGMQSAANGVATHPRMGLSAIACAASQITIAVFVWRLTV
jgi:hypothetical protein